MTNKKAIELLNELMDNEAYLNEYSGANNEPMNVALQLAIETLEKMPEEPEYEETDLHDKIKELLHNRMLVEKPSWVDDIEMLRKTLIRSNEKCASLSIEEIETVWRFYSQRMLVGFMRVNDYNYQGFLQWIEKQ